MGPLATERRGRCKASSVFTGVTPASVSKATESDGAGEAAREDPAKAACFRLRPVGGGVTPSEMIGAGVDRVDGSGGVDASFSSML